MTGRTGTPRRVLLHNGKIKALYEDGFSPKMLEALGGKAEIRRASHVEAPARSLAKVEFEVDLGPSGGPKMTGFGSYKEAVQAEIRWINENTLNPNNQPNQPNQPNPLP